MRSNESTFDLHALYCVARQMEKICQRHAPDRFTQVVEEALVERAREQIRHARELTQDGP